MSEIPTRTQDDAALVRAALERREEAIEVLMTRLECVPRILRALNSRRARPLGEHDLADLVQDSLAIVLRKLRSFPDGYKIEPWAYRICVYELANAGRRVDRRPHGGPVEGWEAAIEDQKAPEDDHAEVYWAMEHLASEESAVIRAKCLDGDTFQEVAERLGISLGTVKTRYYRGLGRLREILATRTTQRTR